MIDCPKCKFRQPKDQYCANCGIDMIAFKPLHSEDTESFFKSGLFQVMILIAIAAVVSYFISQNNRPQNWVRKITYSAKSGTNTAIPPISTPTENTTQEVQVVTSPEANLNALAAEPPTGLQNESAAETENQTAEIKFTFVEINRNDLLNWINESQRLDLYQSMTDFSVGIIPNYKSRFQTTYKELKSEQKKLFIKKPQALLFGKTIEETSEFIGLQTNLDLKSKENQSTKGHVNITKVTRYGKTELPIEFELSKDALFFIHWKTALVGLENENFLFSTPPFQILKSQDFLSQKSEFIILIEPISP